MLYKILLIVCIVSVEAGVCFAGRSDVADRVAIANGVLKDMMSLNEAIPQELLEVCSGIAIFPNTFKAGFIVGVNYGKGVFVAKDPVTGKWHGPVFLTIGGGSFGWQIGAQVTDFVLVVMNQRGVSAFMKDNVTLGGDLSVAVGPVGRKMTASTDIALSSEVYSYSRTRGFFAGVSLTGAYLHNDYESNELFYQKAMLPREILNGKILEQPKEVEQLLASLDKCCK